MTWLPRWLEYSFVLIAAWLVAGVIVGERVEDISMPTSGLGSGEISSSFVVDEGLLHKVHLFGDGTAELAAADKPVAVTVSKLKVKLIGTVVAGKKSAAMVLMGESKMQQVFFIDQVMQPNVILRSVEATEITVDNHGNRERISIEEGKEIASTPPSTVRAMPGPRGARSREHVGRKIDKSNLQKQMRNFSTLMSQARVTPHFTDKKADGFTISEIVKGSLYEEVGLQNGDVIQKVNGESVTSAEQAMRMYRELQSATFIDVEINRGGTVQQISYTIQ